MSESSEIKDNVTIEDKDDASFSPTEPHTAKESERLAYFFFF